MQDKLYIIHLSMKTSPMCVVRRSLRKAKHRGERVEVGSCQQPSYLRRIWAHEISFFVRNPELG